MAERAFAPAGVSVGSSPPAGGGGAADAALVVAPEPLPPLLPCDIPPALEEYGRPAPPPAPLLSAFSAGVAITACIDIDNGRSSPFFFTAWSKVMPTCDSFCSLVRAWA